MFFAFLKIFCLSKALSSNLFIIKNSHTSDSLIKSIQANIRLSQVFDIDSISIQEDILNSGMSSEMIILDLTQKSENFPILDNISRNLETVYITLTPQLEHSFSEFRYYLRPSTEIESACINQLISYLEWDKFSIFSSATFKDLTLANSVGNSHEHQVFSFLPIISEISKDSLDSIVKKLIKAAGIRKLFIIGGGSQIQELQSIIQKRKLELPGSQFIFSSEGIYSAFVNGSIIVAYSGTETSASEEEFELNLVMKILRNLEPTYFKSKLVKICPDHTCIREFSIVNIQLGLRKIVGKCSDSLIITEQVVYPGPTLEKVALSKSNPITVSIANGTSEPYLNTSDYSYAKIYKGAEYAVYRSNLHNEIPNFHIELKPTDCGNSYPDTKWYLECFDRLKGNLGVAYLTSLASVSANASYEVLNTMNHSIPQLSPLSNWENLNNKTQFPYLLKLGISNFDFVENFLFFLLSKNWKSIIFFGSDDTPYYLQYIEYLKDIESIRINIVNPVEKMIFRSNYSREDFEEYRDYYEFAKESKCRIYLITVPDSALILEGLYDVGLRKEDVVIFTGISMYFSMITNVSNIYRKKREEFLPCLNIFTYKEWVGDLGKVLNEEISTFVNFTPTYLCVTYDTISVVKATISHLLALGEDYDDPITVMNSMRMQRLTGCMGNIYFLSENNLVATFKIGLGNLIYKESSSQYLICYYATSYKYDTSIITYSRQVKWPSGSEEAPSNFIDFGTCQIDQRLVSSSSKSKKLLVIIASLFFTEALICALLSCKITKMDLEKIPENKESSFGDYAVIGYILANSFQILAITNEKGLFDYIGIQFHKLIGLNFISYYNLNFMKYWSLFKTTLCLNVIYIIGSLIYFKPISLLEKYNLFERFKDYLYFYLVMYGHILFLPILNIFFSIFMCSNQIDDNLSSSYLDYDCTIFCYTGYHFNYTLTTIISTFLYIAISIIARPFWSLQQNNLNIKTKSSFTSILSLFQVALVLLSYILKSYNKKIAGFVLSILVFVFSVITIKLKPFNYERGFAYQLISILVTFWCVLLSGAYEFYENKFFLALVMFIGVALLLLVGILVVRKIPEEFLPQKNLEYFKLIEWLFLRRRIYQVPARTSSNTVMTSQAADIKESEPNKINQIFLGKGNSSVQFGDKIG